MTMQVQLRKPLITPADFRALLIPLLSVGLALLAGALVLLAAHRNPLLAYAALFKGSLGDPVAIADTLSRATPIIFSGLAVALAFRAGLFNIGVEGQLLMGGIAAAFVGHKISAPMYIHLPLVMVVAAAAGGLWAALPGYLKARSGVHEVINTIMMNYIAYAFTAFAIEALRNGVVPKTPDVSPTAQLFRLAKALPFLSGSTLNLGFILALAACGIIYYLLWHTVSGYEIRAVGLNSAAAEYGGIKVGRNLVLAMTLSGMIAGLGGAERVLGVHGSFISGISPGYGFEGIAVALLGNNHPGGIILAALLFAVLSSGGLYMDMTADVPVDIVVIIQALIILFVAAHRFIRQLIGAREVTHRG